jgi:hypothetical protein
MFVLKVVEPPRSRCCVASDFITGRDVSGVEGIGVTGFLPFRFFLLPVLGAGAGR